MDNFVLYNVPGKEDGEVRRPPKAAKEVIFQNDVSREMKCQTRYVYLTAYLILAMNTTVISQGVVWWHLQRMKMVEKMKSLK